jgi:hypothetical protein
VFGYPGDGINGLLGAWGRADDHPQFVQARSTCSTACTTPSSTTSRSWPSSARPSARPWAAPTSRRSTC